MKTISLTLFAALLVQSSAWSADCRDAWVEAKKEARISRSIQKTLQANKGVPIGTVTAVAAGIAVDQSGASPALVVGSFLAGGFLPAAAVSGFGALKNIQYNKMIRLIDQADEFKATDGKVVGKILKRLSDRIDDLLDVSELADLIIAANRDGSLCEGKLLKFSKVDEAIHAGQLRIAPLTE